MDTIAVIYLLTNTVNSKRYVGFTTNLKATLGRHKGRAGKWDFYLSHAIAKHGWERFTCEVLASGKDVAYMKDVMEPHFIRELGTFHEHGKGYNMTWGGEGTLGYKRTPEQLRQMSESRKGRRLTEKHKAALRERFSGENNPRYGAQVTEETRRKLSEGVKRAFAEGRGKRVWTQEQRQELSARAKAQANRPEHIERIRQLGKACAGKPGHPHTEEHKQRMSQMMTGRQFDKTSRLRMSYAQCTYIWLIHGPEDRVYEICALDRFCKAFDVKRETVEKTLDPTWIPYRKRRCPWTGLSKRPITEEDRERFKRLDAFWREVSRDEPIYHHPTRPQGPLPKA
jgi:group I intron endonuclease